MGFTTPAFLWALPVAAIPLVIYLILRWRRKDVEWGSIYILRRVLETKSRIRAWLQYLVIALRTLALVAVVLALAGLAGRHAPSDAEAFPQPPPATHRVVLLDNSASMAARHEASTRLEAALGLCRRMIGGGVAPGRLDLVPLAGGHEPIGFEAFPISRIMVEEWLSAVATPAGRADFAAGLVRAADILRGSPSERRELYILSDFAAGNFGDNNFGGGNLGDTDEAAAADVDEIRSRLKKLAASGVAIRCVRYDSPRTANFSLLECTPHADLLLARQPTPFHVTVGFSGNVPDGETVLSIEADRGTGAAQVLHEQPLAMTPGQQTLAVPLALPAGRHTLTALLRPDALPSDDAVTRSYDVAGSLRVMLVQDIGDARGFDDPRTWLDIALANANPAGPGAAGNNAAGNGAAGAGAAKAGAAADGAAGAGGDTRARALAEAAANLKRDEFAAGDAAAAGLRIDLEGKIPEQVNAELLEGVDLLIVSGVGRIEPAVVETIRRHVSRGGLVLLSPKPEQNVADFNAAWAAIAPARLDAARWNAVDPERYESCAAESLSSPLWRELESTEHGNLANARFYNHFTLEPGSLADSSEVILSVGDGGPLLLERRVGRGGVLLWTAGLSHHWHSLVVHPGFPVLLVRLAALAADRGRFPVNVQAGAPLVMRTEAAEVRVVRPDGESEVVPAVAQGQARFVRYARTDRPGTYDIREDVESPLPGRLFTVARDDRPESDLRPAAGRLRDLLEQSAGGGWFDSEAALADAVRRGYPGPSWVLPMALVMLAGLLGEAAVSRWLLA